MRLLVVPQVGHDAQSWSGEDSGVERHLVEVALQELQREGEVEDTRVPLLGAANLGEGLLAREQARTGRARASYREGLKEVPPRPGPCEALHIRHIYRVLLHKLVISSLNLG